MSTTLGDDVEGGPSSVELVKLQSNRLRGTLREAVESPEARFNETDAQLLKFHGAYQQDDRDQRTKRGEAREKHWQMMVRLTIPGGALTWEQYLALDALADRVGNGTLRLTTRQSIQYHGVLKGNLKPLLAAVNDTLLTTIAACGDVSRNVMASPAPVDDEIHRDVLGVARGIATELRPSTGAYYEIWLDGEAVTDSRDEEPVYGDAYLPRKFKTGVAIDTDNSVDIYSYDCGLVAITADGRITGYNLVVGGGFGITHNKANTFARLGSTIACVDPEHAVAAVRAVCELFRDAGNRSDRRQARLKYLVEQWGVERFTEELRRRVPFTLHPPAPVPPPRQHDFLGAHPQGDGTWFFGVFVPNGRIDDGRIPLRTALRDLVRTLHCNVRITPMQSLIFTDLQRDEVLAVRRFLTRHGVPLETDLTNLVRYSMACPAMPTCGLALADSERALPGVLEQLDGEFHRLGIQDVPLTVRMTGCPNGCARPYNADIGFVGRRPGVYHVYVGGSLGGDRLADLFAGDVGVSDIVSTLRPLLEQYARDRTTGEALGDFYQRALLPRPPRALLTGREQPTAGQFQ
ncbi:MAG: NADPH-dependent assimilatory sulfite reductase hemoprotein subunit [Gemmatimonadaceae bacterium]|nr:NADPH-dependent assimilatory sulfite reductase hemoprotein subunit [Gemmatimonadaceae bacterium]